MASSRNSDGNLDAKLARIATRVHDSAAEARRVALDQFPSIPLLESTFQAQLRAVRTRGLDWRRDPVEPRMRCVKLSEFHPLPDPKRQEKTPKRIKR